MTTQRNKHAMAEKRYTHNGSVQRWWECSAGDWTQDHIEHGRTIISAKVARQRFNDHLPRSDPRRVTTERQADGR